MADVAGDIGQVEVAVGVQRSDDGSRAGVGGDVGRVEIGLRGGPLDGLPIASRLMSPPLRVVKPMASSSPS